MKLCMIGSRGHCGYAFAGLPDLPQVTVAGVSAGTPEDAPDRLLEESRRLGHEPEVFDDYRLMLDRLRPDLVCIDGPFERHAEMCVACFERGLHVFCEKPVATTPADLGRVERAYRRAGTHFAGMMGLRYEPAFFSAWQAVRAGAVGEVRLISARKSYKLGSRPEFYRRRATYGGTLPWVGSHAFDWILWFSGCAVESVYAVHTTAANRNHGELEMSAACLFTLAGSVFATATIDYLRPDGAPTHGDDRVRVAGTAGVVEVRGGRVYLVNGEAEGEQEPAAACDRQIFCDFVGQVEGRGPGLVSGAETIELTRVCLLALMSADEGRVVCREEAGAAEEGAEV